MNPSAATAKVTPYYTGEAGVKLYSEPRFSSTCIVELPLHQKVYRSKVESGFAYVEVEGSGKKGWLDNSKLVWRLSAPATPLAAPAVPDAPAEKPADDRNAAPAPITQTTGEPPADGPIVAPAATDSREAGSESLEPDQTEQVDPSIFSPF